MSSAWIWELLVSFTWLYNANSLHVWIQLCDLKLVYAATFDLMISTISVHSVILPMPASLLALLSSISQLTYRYLRKRVYQRPGGR
jgi:hypothetical protein